MSLSWASQPGRSFLSQVAEVDVTLEEVGAGDFQPRIGVHLALRSVIILEERGMAVVEGQEPAGHSGLAGEPGGRVREEDRLFAQADHAALAGHLVKEARPDPEREPA